MSANCYIAIVPLFVPVIVPLFVPVMVAVMVPVIAPVMVPVMVPVIVPGGECKNNKTTKQESHQKISFSCLSILFRPIGRNFCSSSPIFPNKIVQQESNNILDEILVSLLGVCIALHISLKLFSADVRRRIVVIYETDCT